MMSWVGIVCVLTVGKNPHKKMMSSALHLWLWEVQRA